MQSRRNFLKLLGMAVGASLTGCGGSSDSVFTGTSGSPNAYQFVPLITSGRELPGGANILAQASGEDPPFYGVAQINDLRHVIFHANDSQNRTGAYRVDYDESGQITPAQTLIREGDTMPDGTLVDYISPGDLNNFDDAVFMVEDPEGNKTLQYSKEGQAFERLCNAYTDLSDEARLYGDLHPETRLSDEGDIMFCCAYRDGEGDAKGQGLFYIPKESVSGTKRLLSKEQLVPGTSAEIANFGLFDITPQGDYVVQGSASLIEAGQEADQFLTYLLKGRVDGTPELLAGSSALGQSGANQGEVYMGVRLGGQEAAYVLQTGEERTELWLERRQLLVGDPVGESSTSPRGGKIIGMFPPVFGPNGLLFVEVFTENTAEILLYNGRNFSSILSTGDIVNGKVVSTIVFGAVEHCVNVHGEFVCVVEFTDGQSALIVGLPV